jgi:hypothetical protein
MLKKNIWASFQGIIELFTKKFITKLSKIWVWDLGLGVKKAPDPGSGFATLGFFFKKADRTLVSGFESNIF